MYSTLELLHSFRKLAWKNAITPFRYLFAYILINSQKSSHYSKAQHEVAFKWLAYYNFTRNIAISQVVRDWIKIIKKMKSTITRCSKVSDRKLHKGGKEPGSSCGLSFIREKVPPLMHFRVYYSLVTKWISYFWIQGSLRPLQEWKRALSMIL